MRRPLIIVTAVVWIVVIAEVVRRRVAPAIVDSSLSGSPLSASSLLAGYPPAPPMPAVIETPVADVLAQYEAFLRKDAPAVFAALQPGLSDAEIEKLEKDNGFQLPADLRALYQWHNGTLESAHVDAFPSHEFVPLDAAIARRQTRRKELEAQSFVAKALDDALIGHRMKWLDVIVDAAGDGYFLDPDRTEAKGSFFFNFAETGSYEFFPSFRNYLAAVLAGQASGVYVVGPHGIDTSDFVRAHSLMNNYGAEYDPGAN